jgi:hypothetical protein
MLCGLGAGVAAANDDDVKFFGVEHLKGAQMTLALRVEGNPRF